MRTQDEVEEEIRKLKDLELLVPPLTAFGGDNRAMIRAEIKVLEQDLSEDDIWDLEGIVEGDTLTVMLGARRWLDGEDAYRSPSEGWAMLVG